MSCQVFACGLVHYLLGLVQYTLSAASSHAMQPSLYKEGVDFTRQPEAWPADRLFALYKHCMVYVTWVHSTTQTPTAYIPCQEVMET